MKIFPKWIFIFFCLALFSPAFSQEKKEEEFRKFFDSAKKAKEKNLFYKAAIQFEEAWKIFPQKEEVGLEAAICFAKIGEYENSAKILKTLLSSKNAETVKSAKEIWNTLEPFVEKIYTEHLNKGLQRKKLLQKIMVEAEVSCNDIDPDWHQTIALYKKAKEYCEEDATLKTEINTKIKECQKNLQAQKIWILGEKHWQEEDFATAKKYFSEISEETLYYYKKAIQRILEIQRQDDIFLGAQQSYSRGEGEKALKQLRALNDFRSLNLRKKIEKIVQYMSLGEKLKENQCYGEAIFYFQKILNLEKNPCSYYYLAARKFYHECEICAPQIAMKSYNEGMRALERKDYGQALTSFHQTIKNDLTNTYSKKIQEELKIRSNELYLLAKNIRIQGKINLYSKATNMCNLLKILPKEDLCRRNAEKLLEELEKK